MVKPRKAVIPVAGLGTRFLPATKAIPKEMLTVVDKPVIQYVVEEAWAAGIEHIIFVTGRNKNVIEDHFDTAPELEQTLESKGKTDFLELVRGTQSEAGQISFTRQQRPMGLGHAIWCARELVGNEPFAVMLPDVLMRDTRTGRGCLTCMMELFESRENLIAVEKVPEERVSNYGILDVDDESAATPRVRGMVEKPPVADAPSRLAISGRYLLQPELFEHLSKQEKGAGGEIQLTDAMLQMLASQTFRAFVFEGETHDCGDKMGWLVANVAYALGRPDFSESARNQIRSILNGR